MRSDLDRQVEVSGLTLPGRPDALALPHPGGNLDFELSGLLGFPARDRDRPGRAAVRFLEGDLTRPLAALPRPGPFAPLDLLLAEEVFDPGAAEARAPAGALPARCEWSAPAKQLLEELADLSQVPGRAVHGVRS